MSGVNAAKPPHLTKLNDSHPRHHSEWMPGVTHMLRYVSVTQVQTENIIIICAMTTLTNIPSG